MNKKTIIELVIVVVAFGSAGLILYNGLFSGSNNAAILPLSATTGADAQQNILPYGTTLDFTASIIPNRFQYNQLVYPQVTLKDIGISPSNLIQPLQVAPQTPAKK